MSPQTILFIVVAGIIAFGLTLFMYGYKTNYSKRLRWIFGFLRFITLFSIFLLLINPKFKSETFTIENPKLVVLADNSSSIKELKQEENVTNFITEIRNNEDLNKKFDLHYFNFGSQFKELDSLGFSENKTNIDNALENVSQLFKNEAAPTILITDGNQTFGKDYEFSSTGFSNQIYPLIAGDSIQYLDLKIEQLNTNRYSFLKNEFPVEAIIVYSGKGSVNSKFSIRQGGSTVFSENLSFSNQDNTKIVSFTLPASKVGLLRYTAQISPLTEEKNKTNNYKSFAVEVIDQATNVLVVSDIIHPDIGVLKKAIETNEQRKVTFKKPSETLTILNEYQLVILYQPTQKFSQVFSEIDKLKKNVFIISGLQTDWNFLNNIQKNFSKEATNQTEEITGALNPNYGTYAVEDIGFDDFPPLKTEFGVLSINIPHEVLLDQTIDGFSTESPLFSSMEINGRRQAIWDGEGFWRWRAQTFLQNDNFKDFDEFIGKIVQYLASNKRRSRLEVSNETFYYNNNPLTISAQYFDKNFVFDNRAQLEITVVNKETKERTVFPMLLKNNFFEINLSSLEAGDYNFTVSEKNEAVSRSGSFTILDFNVEQQFLNADVTKLTKIATNTGGKPYFITEGNNLIQFLLETEEYKSIQKSNEKVVPLIDWKYLLALIILSLTAEWFIRKYNGLI